jgi:hypothetical protein
MSFFILGLINIAVFIAVLFLGIVRWVLGYARILILTRFEVNDFSRDGVYINIEGRASGFLHWILHLFGLVFHTSLKVNDRELHLKSASAFKIIESIAPLASVSSTNCGYYKPFWMLLVACLLIVNGFVMAFGFSRQYGIETHYTIAAAIPYWILSVVCLLAYVLSKRIMISFEARGSKTFFLAFRRSVIENVAIDINFANKALIKLNELIGTAQSGAGIMSEEQPSYAHEISVQQATYPSSKIEERLMKIEALKKSGVISYEEYLQKRQQIIDDV